MFNPRFTKPKEGNRYYNKPNNKAIYGNPKQKGLDVLSNCVGYANGRFNEIIGEFKYQLVSNAGSFIKYYCNEKVGLKYNTKPHLGGIMVWESSGAGHVAIVEEVSIDGKTIITSESAYGGTAFYTTKRTNKNGRWGMNERYDFIGCIINPYVNTIPKVQEQEIKTNEIKYEVKKGDTLSSIARKYKTTWQKIYNDNKDTIDEIAKSHGKSKALYNWIYPKTMLKIIIENK